MDEDPSETLREVEIMDNEENNEVKKLENPRSIFLKEENEDIA